MIDKLSNQNLPSNSRFSEKPQKNNSGRSHQSLNSVNNNNNNRNGTSNNINTNNTITNNGGSSYNDNLNNNHIDDICHTNGHSIKEEPSQESSPPISKLILNYPPGPNKKLKDLELTPPTPSLFVQSEAEIFSPQLQEFCLANPIAVIRNISRVLKLNLGLFSTKTLVNLDSGHQIEVRTQLEQPSDENWDTEKKNKIWRCESPRRFSKIGKYALYQARTFQNNLIKGSGMDQEFNAYDQTTPVKKNPHLKYVTFGTNVDLSDSKKWKAQLDELDKLPMFSRVVSGSNMLSHVGHPILGMNTVQLYMKVPGCRTPGHQENNNFCSVNINIGPGDCEWFGVPEEYWGSMAKLCAENGTNFVHGSWWPNLSDLSAYNIPVYRFIQKPGDLVWVNTGTVHWVQAIGWCNNIAWNVGPITCKQFRSATERYEWNKVERYKSIVPMIHLTWNLARNVEIHEEALFLVIKEFMTTSLNYCERVIQGLEEHNVEIKWHGKAPHEAAHYCANCEMEVFNILFVKSIEKKLVVHCAKCAIEASQILENFVVLQEYDMNDLRATLANFTQTFRNRRINNKIRTN